MVNLWQRLRRLQPILALLPPPRMKKKEIQVMDGMGR
jgi:hypothetical protein